MIVDSAPGNTIGGTAAGAGNTIFQNSVDVLISGGCDSPNVLLGDSIDISEIGVEVESANNTISASSIQNNSDAGVSISGPAATGNVVIGSTIGADGVGVIIESPDNTDRRHGRRRPGTSSSPTTPRRACRSRARGPRGTSCSATPSARPGPGAGGNGVGVIIDSASANTIGGTAAGASNSI